MIFFKTFYCWFHHWSNYKKPSIYQCLFLSSFHCLIQFRTLGDKRWKSVIRRCAQVSSHGQLQGCDWGYDCTSRSMAVSPPPLLGIVGNKKWMYFLSLSIWTARGTYWEQVMIKLLLSNQVWSIGKTRSMSVLGSLQFIIIFFVSSAIVLKMPAIGAWKLDRRMEFSVQVFPAGLLDYCWLKGDRFHRWMSEER